MTKRKRENNEGKEEGMALDLNAIQEALPQPDNQNPGFILQLPNEILMLIFAFLDNKSRAQWIQTAKPYYGLFNNDLLKFLKITLNTHVVCGKEKAVSRMIAIRPEGLTFRSTVFDYSDRIFKNVTPFQAAILCHDVALWNKMEPFFKKIPDGAAEKARQFKEIFPNGVPAQAPYDFSALIQIISNSSVAQVNTQLNNPLDDTSLLGQRMKSFRENFTALSMQELFFNPWHLWKAFDVYNQQYGLSSLSQRRLFWTQVIGYIQRFLPACYAQAFCQGLCEVAELKSPLNRVLKVKGDARLYFPLIDSSGIGFNYGIYSYCETAWTSSTYRPLSRLEASFKTLCDSKTKALLTLQKRIESIEHPSQTATP